VTRLGSKASRCLTILSAAGVESSEKRGQLMHNRRSGPHRLSISRGMVPRRPALAFEGRSKKMTEEKPTRIKFHYIKSSQFRVVHVDGFIGGPTPRLDLHVAIFSERAAIPQQIEHVVKEDGSLGEEIAANRIGKDGIVREVEFDAVMDLDVAKAFQKWLGEQIMTIESVRSQAGGKP